MPEDVERSDECGTLSAVVVESQQLEAGVVGGAEVALDLVLVTECLQASAGLEELACHRSHAVVAQQVAEDLEVAGLVGAGVLGNLAKIREGAPLTLLVGNDGGIVSVRREA